MNLPISGKRCLFCYRNVQTCTSHGLSFSIQRGRPPSTGSGPFCSFCHFFFSCSASLSSLICLFLPPLGMNHFFFFPLPRDSCFPSLLLCLYFPSQCFLPEFPFCCCFNLSLTHITLSFSVFTTVWYFPELLWLSWGSSYHCIIQFLPCWKKKKKYATCFSTVSVHEGDNSVKKCHSDVSDLLLLLLLSIYLIYLGYLVCY